MVYTFDFKHIMGQQCDEVADYEQWFAHEDIKLNNDQEKGCQLGQKHVYQKLKKDSICYQGMLAYLLLRLRHVVKGFLARFFNETF